MKILTLLDTWLAKCIGWIVVLFLSVMILLSFGQVLLRNFFSSGIIWADVLLRHLVLWLGFLGAALATGENRHIRIDFLTKFLPHKIKKVFYIITNIFAVVVCYYLLRASISFIEIGIEPDSILIFNLPLQYFIIIIPIGYGIMAFRFLVLVLRWLVEIFQKNWEVKETL